MFQLRSVPVLSDVVIFLSSIIVLTPNGNFWIVPLLHSAREINFYTAQLREQEEIHQSYVVATYDLGSSILAIAVKEKPS
jgi:hypothetical protein